MQEINGVGRILINAVYISNILYGSTIRLRCRPFRHHKETLWIDDVSLLVNISSKVTWLLPVDENL